jgi:hypothetical protein
MTMARRSDPIIEEIHEARREIAEQFGGDVRRISADARERLRRKGRPVWRPKANQAVEQYTEDPKHRE